MKKITITILLCLFTFPTYSSEQLEEQPEAIYHPVRYKLLHIFPDHIDYIICSYLATPQQRKLIKIFSHLIGTMRTKTPPYTPYPNSQHLLSNKVSLLSHEKENEIFKATVLSDHYKINCEYDGQTLEEKLHVIHRQPSADSLPHGITTINNIPPTSIGHIFDNIQTMLQKAKNENKPGIIIQRNRYQYFHIQNHTEHLPQEFTITVLWYR